MSGLKATRVRVINALRNGSIAHEARDNDPMGERNYLRAELITTDEVIRLLGLCQGRDYEASPHHDTDMPCDVHIFKPRDGRDRWYIKVFFIGDLVVLAPGAPDAMFISVHPSVYNNP